MAVKHEIQKRLSTLRNPSSKWISNKKFSSGSHGFICFAFFREIQKGSLLEGVSMRLTVGYKKKKKIALDFLIVIHLEDRLFSVEIRFCFSFFTKKNAKSVFQNFNLDLPIESTQNFRAVFSIFHKYSHLFWTLLSRNKIIFIKPTAFRLFDHLIKAILGSKFLKNWLIHV